MTGAVQLRAIFDRDGRLLACGNGGSAAEAQHLTGELVGRFREERRPLSAIALHADSSALTAIGNDYGPEEVYARQVRAHGRPGDVLVAFSTSGTSPDVVAAAKAAEEIGLTVWALTGPAPNPLAALADSRDSRTGPDHGDDAGDPPGAGARAVHRARRRTEPVRGEGERRPTRRPGGLLARRRPDRGHPAAQPGRRRTGGRGRTATGTSGWGRVGSRARGGVRGRRRSGHRAGR